MGMGAAAIEEIGGDPAFVLGERAEPATGMDRLRSKTMDYGLMDHALEPAAMDRELRHLVARIEPALLVPDLLAVARQVKQLMGANRDFIEPVQQTDARQLTDR